MEIQKKLTAVLTFIAVLFGGFQIACAATIPPVLPIATYILKNVLKQKGADKFPPLQPGFDATLLMNQPARFSVENSANKIITCKDQKGKKFFEKTLNAVTDSNNGFIDIVPAKEKLKAGQKYSWSVNGDSNTYTFTVLDEQTEKELLGNLAEIEQMNFSSEECTLIKATYLQYVSDDSKGNLDFYWLSAQLLSEISPTDDERKNEKSYLLKKCRQHFLSQKGQRQ